VEAIRSIRRGLRFPVRSDDAAFLPFFDLVQNTASKQGKVFFLDCGQSREFEDEKMAGEDLSGWLISANEADVFESEWKKGWNSIEDRFFKDFVWAKWREAEGKIHIDFVKM